MAIAKRIELLLIDLNESFSEAEARIAAGLDALEWQYDLVVHKKSSKRSILYGMKNDRIT